MSEEQQMQCLNELRQLLDTNPGRAKIRKVLAASLTLIAEFDTTIGIRRPERY